MNKTISINIGGRNFFIEEQAFARLDEYLKSIKAHFAALHGSEEIITDMESRIAEKFSEQHKDNPQAVITEEDVQSLILELGTVEELTGGSASEPKASQESFAPKRLYRDPDNAMIGGVCAGIAAYFDIDTPLVRIGFLLLLLLGGAIIPVYLVLWLILPEAKTPTEKMQMRGKPLNISTISQNIKERAEEVKKNSGKIRSGANTIAHRIGSIIRILFKLVGKIAGLIVILLSIFAMTALTFIAANAAFNTNSPYIDFPLRLIAQDPAYYGLVALAYGFILIPLIFVIILGIGIFRRKSIIPASIGFSLLGIWLLLGITGGVIATRKVPQFVEQVKSSPEMQDITKTYDQSGFTHIQVSGWNNYKLIEGQNFGVKAVGKTHDIGLLEVANVNGVLKISEKNENRVCLFCISQRADIEITAPSTTIITVTDGAHLTVEKLSATSTQITLINGARMSASGITAKQITLKLDNSSRAELEGTTDALNVNLDDFSRLEADNLKALIADVQARHASTAHVHAETQITILHDHRSNVYYTGNPKVTSVEDRIRGTSDDEFNIE